MRTDTARTIIQTLISGIVQQYAPRKIILFGSYLGEHHTEDSDIDLLIIKDTQEGFSDRLVRVRQAVLGRHRGIPFDPLVLTPWEVEERLKVGDQFIAEILEKGETLYAT